MLLLRMFPVPVTRLNKCLVVLVNNIVILKEENLREDHTACQIPALADLAKNNVQNIKSCLVSNIVHCN